MTQNANRDLQRRWIGKTTFHTIETKRGIPDLVSDSSDEDDSEADITNDFGKDGIEPSGAALNIPVGVPTFRIGSLSSLCINNDKDFIRRACNGATSLRTGGISDRRQNEYYPARDTRLEYRAWGSFESSTSLCAEFCIFPGSTAMADMSTMRSFHAACVQARQPVVVLAQVRFGP